MIGVAAAAALAAALAQWAATRVATLLGLAAVQGVAVACLLAGRGTEPWPREALAAGGPLAAAAGLGLLARRCGPGQRDRTTAYGAVAAAIAIGLLLGAANLAGDRVGLAPLALAVVSAAPLAWRRDPLAQVSSLCTLGFAAELAVPSAADGFLLGLVLLAPPLWLGWRRA